MFPPYMVSAMVMGAVFTLLFLSNQSLSARVRQLRRESAHLRLVIAQQEQIIEKLASRPRKVERPQDPDLVWKRRWAKERLGILVHSPSPAEVRTGRRNAIKSSHPDQGGSAERMREIDEAVEILMT